MQFPNLHHLVYLLSPSCSFTGKRTPLTHLGLLWREGAELAFLKPSLTLERRHESFSDLDRTGGPESSLEPPRSPAPEALRVSSERDVSVGAAWSGRASGAKLSSMICLALSQI